MWQKFVEISSFALVSLFVILHFLLSKKISLNYGIEGRKDQPNWEVSIVHCLLSSFRQVVVHGSEFSSNNFVV